MPWSTTADEAQMMSMLRSGEIQALVLDSPWVQYTAASNCDMFVVGDMVLPVDLVSHRTHGFIIRCASLDIQESVLMFVVADMVLPADPVSNA